VLRDILFLVFNISEPLVRPPETGV
jgi:hypothetical protein